MRSVRVVVILHPDAPGLLIQFKKFHIRIQLILPNQLIPILEISPLRVRLPGMIIGRHRNIGRWH